MTAGETVRELDSFDAPYGRQIVIQEVRHDSGLNMLRIRIREGSRFTILDLDAATAERWSAIMSTWAKTAGGG